jgi:two-component system, chemotaxis family, response regulator Rcp1
MADAHKLQEILLVEDNPADVYLIQKAFAECGPNFRLWFVPNGQDALGFLRQEGPYIHAPSPALILLDLNIPKLRGEELLVELRRLPAYQTTPVVVLSAADEAIAAPMVLGVGANAYVRKPLTFHEFFAAIHAIVNRWLTSNAAS